MSMTIVVPLDGSTFAEHALATATRIVATQDGSLHLVQVHETPVIPSTPEHMVSIDAEMNEQIRQRELQYLEQRANQLAGSHGLRVVTQLVDGQPANTIALYAREVEADFVVMTTHGRTGLSRAWLGSVADGVIRRSRVPVLLIRPPSTGMRFEEVARPRHVLIPMDGSDLSKGIIEPAFQVGTLSEARFTLLRVMLPVPLIRPADGDAKAESDAQDAHAHAELDAIAEELRGRGAVVDVAIVHEAVPAAAILHFAVRNDVDLIALATHGRGGWTRLALGSVADKVLRGAIMPVLVLRPESPARGRRGSADNIGATAN
jgi:nucleotide-binding universal stress UspA family protein